MESCKNSGCLWKNSKKISLATSVSSEHGIALGMGFRVPPRWSAQEWAHFRLFFTTGCWYLLYAASVAHVFATCGLPIISSLPFWLHTLLRWLFLTLRENSLMPWTKLAVAWDFSPHLIFRLRNPRSHRPWRDKYPPHRFFLRAVAQQRHPVHCYQTNYFSKTFTFLFGSEDTELIHRIWSIYKPSLKWLEVE